MTTKLLHDEASNSKDNHSATLTHKETHVDVPILTNSSRKTVGKLDKPPSSESTEGGEKRVRHLPTGPNFKVRSLHKNGISMAMGEGVRAAKIVKLHDVSCEHSVDHKILYPKDTLLPIGGSAGHPGHVTTLAVEFAPKSKRGDINDPDTTSPDKTTVHDYSKEKSTTTANTKINDIKV